MTDAPDEDDRAERRWRARLRTYCAVMALLLIVNLTTSPGTWWVQWPALGWGIGLLFERLRVTERRERSRDRAPRREAPPLELPEAEPAAPADDDLQRRAEALLERERRAR